MRGECVLQIGSGYTGGSTTRLCRDSSNHCADTFGLDRNSLPAIGLRENKLRHSGRSSIRSCHPGRRRFPDPPGASTVRLPVTTRFDPLPATPRIGRDSHERQTECRLTLGTTSPASQFLRVAGGPAKSFHASRPSVGAAKSVSLAKDWLTKR